MTPAELDRVARRAGLPILKETPMPDHPQPLIAQAWHDVTCPEGPDRRDRLLHSASEVLANTGVLARFLDRLHELETPTTCGHPADFRCLDCAADDELLASLPPFPGGAR